MRDGRLVVAEGSGESWLVYIEDDPGKCSGGTLDGLVIAEVLGCGVNDEYPARFDEWAEQVKAS